MSRAKISTSRILESIIHIVLVMQGIPAFAYLLVAVFSLFTPRIIFSHSLYFFIFGGFSAFFSLCGLLFFKRTIKNSLALNTVATVFGWIFSSVVCALPFFLVSPDSVNMAVRQPLNAWYESVSSVTSCGLSLVARPSLLEPSVQLWRSLCQWIGGVGIAVFAIYLLEPASLGRGIYAAENHSWRPVKRLRGIATRMLASYSLITLACILCFALLGMPGWQALNHGLTISSTGGLTVTDDSFTGYSSAIKLVSCFFMLVGAASFAIIYSFGKFSIKNAIRSSAFRGFLVWSAILFFGVTLIEYINNGPGEIDRVIFNLCSAITTCGVSSGTIDYHKYTFAVFMMAIFIGGMKDSTAGGFKLDRLIWMNKVFLWQLRCNLTRKNMERLPNWNGDELSRSQVYQRSSSTLATALLFTASLALGAMALCIVYEQDFHAIFQCASALGAVGLTMGVGGPDRSDIGKFVEIILMIAGRLEIQCLFLVIPVMLGRIPENVEISEREDVYLGDSIEELASKVEDFTAQAISSATSESD